MNYQTHYINSKKFYEDKKPFTVDSLSFYVHVYLYESGIYIGEFTLSLHSKNFDKEYTKITESIIYNNIDKLLKKQ